MTILRAIVFGLLVVAGTPSLSVAYPIVLITGGTATKEPGVFFVLDFAIVGTEGYSFFGVTVGGSSPINETPLPAGTTLNLGGSATNPQGLFTFRGETHESGSGIYYGHSTVGINSPSFVIPTTGDEVYRFVQPFTFSGSFGYNQSLERQLIVDLNGSGYATAEIYRAIFPEAPQNLYYLRSLQYTFTDPTAVPEPASLMLLGTGVVVTIARRRRLRKRVER